MGIIHSSSKWYIYSRDSRSESWNSEPLQCADSQNLGTFKHMVWKFALQKSNTMNSCKAIYLYNGSTRYIKAELIKPLIDNYYKLEMEFKDEGIAQVWDHIEEQTVNGCFYEETFMNHYVPLDSNKNWIRRWQLIKPMPNSKPGLPRLTLTEYITSSILKK